MTRLINADWQNFIKERSVAVNPNSKMGKAAHLCDYGILHIAGNDAIKFLQGQLTCDVTKVTSSGTLAAHCNPQGRMISLFYLTKQTPNCHEKEISGDHFFLLMPKLMIPLCTAALKKYAVFFKVTLEDVSEQYLVLGFTNSKLNCSQFIPQIELPDQRTLCIFSLEEAKTFWIQHADQLAMISLAEWHISSLKNLLPVVYPGTSGKFLPHELGLHQLNAISFDKGCYTGQEIIARMHYRGKLKNKMCYFQICAETTLLPGDEIQTQFKERSLTMSLVDSQAIDKEHAHALFIVPQDYASLANAQTAIFSNVKDQTPVHLIANEKHL